MSKSETERAVELIREVTRRQDAAHRRARHGRRLRPRRQDRGARLRRGHRLRPPTPCAPSRAERPAVRAAYLGHAPHMLELDDLHAYYGKSHILHGVSLARRRGRDREPARPQRLRPLDDRQDHHGPGARRGLDPLQARRASTGSSRIEIAHRGIGYVPENRDIFPTLTVRQNLLLGEKSAKAARRWRFDDMYRMFPRLKERAHTGRRALGRRAADADAVPHADGRPRPDHDRRADRRASRRRSSSSSREYLEKIAERGVSVLLIEQKLTIALEISRALLRHGPRAHRLRRHAAASCAPMSACARSGSRSRPPLASAAGKRAANA